MDVWNFGLWLAQQYLPDEWGENVAEEVDWGKGYYQSITEPRADYCRYRAGKILLAGWMISFGIAVLPTIASLFLEASFFPQYTFILLHIALGTLFGHVHEISPTYDDLERRLGSIIACELLLFGIALEWIYPLESAIGSALLIYVLPFIIPLFIPLSTRWPVGLPKYSRKGKTITKQLLKRVKQFIFYIIEEYKRRLS